MSKIGGSMSFGEQLLSELRDSSMRESMFAKADKAQDDKPSGPSFLDHLKEGIEEVNQIQKNADTMATNLATGKQQNIHETMLAATQADLSFNLMVQVRNKVLEAYQEVMRMPI